MEVGQGARARGKERGTEEYSEGGKETGRQARRKHGGDEGGREGEEGVTERRRQGAGIQAGKKRVLEGWSVGSSL